MNHNTCYPAFPLLGCQGQHEGSAGASFELSSFFSYPGQSHTDPRSMHIKRCGLHPLPFFLWPGSSYKNASLGLSAYHLWKQTLWVSLNQLGAFSSSAALQCWGAQLNRGELVAAHLSQGSSGLLVLWRWFLWTGGQRPDSGFCPMAGPWSPLGVGLQMATLGCLTHAHSTTSPSDCWAPCWGVRSQNTNFYVPPWL